MPTNRLKVGITIVVPVMIFYTTSVTAALMLLAGAVLAGYGLGSLDDLVILGTSMAVGLAVTGAVIVELERWTFGPRASRSPTARIRPKHTRLGALGLALLIVVIAPGLSLLQEKYEFQRSLKVARDHADKEVRLNAIRRLGVSRDARALPVLREIAKNRARAADSTKAIRVLPLVPGGKEVLFELTESDDARVRSIAGPELIKFAGEHDAWMRVESLLEEDADAWVREMMTEKLAISQYEIPTEKRARAQELLRRRTNDPYPDVRLRAASRLAGSWDDRYGFESTLAVVMDTRFPGETRRKAIFTLGRIGDKRAAPMLVDILQGHYGEDFIPSEQERKFDHAAVVALRRLGVKIPESSQ